MGKESSLSHIESLKKQYLGYTKHPKVKNVLVLGASKDNIGWEIANKLKDSGFSVSTTHALQYRIQDHMETYKILNDENDWFALVNCVGVMTLDWMEDFDYVEVEKIFDVNLRGAYYASQSFVRRTLELRHPKYVVHIGSMASRVPLNGSAPYCMSKAGLEMLVRCMAWELAPKNYNVIGILPGNTEDTPMEEKTITEIMKLRKITREEAEGYWRTGLIRDRLLSKTEIANLVEFFLQGKCDYLSGACIPLAGGHRLG